MMEPDEAPALDKVNADIVSRVKNNDPRLVRLWLCDFSARVDRGNNYCPEGLHDMELLGYYISKNTELQSLCISTHAETSIEITLDNTTPPKKCWP